MAKKPRKKEEVQVMRYPFIGILLLIIGIGLFTIGLRFGEWLVIIDCPVAIIIAGAGIAFYGLILILNCIKYLFDTGKLKLFCF